MHRQLASYLAALVFALTAVCLPSRGLAATGSPWLYPATKTVDSVDVHFGRSYPDPYRWLEDRKDPEVEAWFKTQAALADSVLDRIPGRDRLVEEWLALDKLRAAAYADIKVEAGRVFYKKTLGGENVGKLYVRESWTGEERLLFDPSGYQAGVTSTLEFFSPSPDGRHVALGVSSGGAEYSELRFAVVESGELLSERYFPTRFGLGWTADATGYFYDANTVADIADPEIQMNRGTRLHRLGTAFADDREIFGRSSAASLSILPEELALAARNPFAPEIIIAGLFTVQREMQFYTASAAELRAGSVNWRVLCRRSDDLVGSAGGAPWMAFDQGYVYAVSKRGAPQFKIVRTSVKAPDWENAETVVAEAKEAIVGFVQTPNFILLTYSDGINQTLRQLNLKTGRLTTPDLPMHGTVAIECPDWRSDRVLVRIGSWVAPSTTYEYDANSSKWEKSVFDTAVAYPGFDQLVVEQIEVPSHDGIKVPLSLIYRSDLRRDGSAAAILTGYGAYGISIQPNFNFRRSIATRQNVVFAVAHVRGGGEKGDAWHRGGFKSTKPNTWKDFIACAEYLVNAGYTRPERLTGSGTSAGGVLITRAITERPDLFAAAVCDVGVGNALRVEFSPNGPINTPEFGSVSVEAEILALAEMDGVRHVVSGVRYPAVLGVVGWNDARVEPWETGKFVAAVQARGVSGKPALLKVNYDSGHFTEDKQVTFANFASQAAFLLWQAGHPDFQPVP